LIILYKSKIIGRYETWPYWRIFFNDPPSKKAFDLTMKGIEDQAIFKGAKVIRIGEIKGCSSTYRKKALNNLLTRGFIIKVTRREVVT